MSGTVDARNAPVSDWISGAVSYDTVDRLVGDPISPHTSWRHWRLAFLLSIALTLLMVGLLGTVFSPWGGVGLWGINTMVVWGTPIAGYVWWIGIGNAGTLISSMLTLTKQSWRASINRFAEAMTLFAVAIAGLFPIIHMGRPLYWYWLAPYPNTMGLWPQWRSALVWDFWAILSYLLFSILFWYVGLLPDLATLRDRVDGPLRQKIFGALALGWRGSARHWHVHGVLHRTMAALAVPLVCSVHSIVGLDFAASLMPGWNETIFPPYFVVGAMFSGFAMVIVLAAFVRRALRLEPIITLRHFDVMAKILLAASIIMGVSYANEWFSGWYSGQPADRHVVAYGFTGDYAAEYWAMLLCNVLVPQLLWFRNMRMHVPALVAIAVVVNIGMALERILIIRDTLSLGELPSMWRVTATSAAEWALIAGSLGTFAFLFLGFVRLLPCVSMHEVKKLVFEERAG